MADRGTPSTRQLALGDSGSIGQIRVDVEAFFYLSLWLSEEVGNLVRLEQKRRPRRFPKKGGVSSLQRAKLQLP
jgi:hypothetical protein